MRILLPACAAAALSIFLTSAAFSFDAAAPDDQTGAVSAQSAAPGGGAAARSAKSIACSQKADAQALHGKERKRFMRECKHAP